MFDRRTLHAREVMERLVEAFGDKVFDSVITRTVRFPETSVAGEPISSWAPKSSGAIQYRNLAAEVIQRVAEQHSATPRAGQRGGRKVGSRDSSPATGAYGLPGRARQLRRTLRPAASADSLAQAGHHRDRARRGHRRVHRLYPGAVPVR